jgi:hypothetical protein
MDAVVLFAIGTTVIGLISVSLNFIFITCLNISAENQVSADSDYVQNYKSLFADVYLPDLQITELGCESHFGPGN